MASLEELEARVTALEAEVRLARQDAAAARVLAGGADRDVEALGAKVDVLKSLAEALRETQVEHGQKIDNMDRRLTRLEQRLDRLEQRVDSLETEMRAGFAKVNAGQEAILTLLNRLIERDGG